MDDDMANLVVAQLLYLDSSSPGDISMYVNSPGGSVTAGMAVFDTMRYVKSDVSTVCVGLAASMGAFLLASGHQGKRYALPNARIMIHQPLGGAQGQAADIEIQANEILHHKLTLNGYLAEFSGQSLERVTSDTDRDFFMSAEEAVEYGLIDAVVSRPGVPVAIPLDKRRQRLINEEEEREIVRAIKSGDPRANARVSPRVRDRGPKLGGVLIEKMIVPRAISNLVIAARNKWGDECMEMGLSERAAFRASDLGAILMTHTGSEEAGRAACFAAVPFLKEDDRAAAADLAAVEAANAQVDKTGGHKVDPKKIMAPAAVIQKRVQLVRAEKQTRLAKAKAMAEAAKAKAAAVEEAFEQVEKKAKGE